MSGLRSRVFYGWIIVGVAFVSLFISVGFSFYSYGAMFKALAAEFGGSRLGISLGPSLLFGATGLLAPFLGHQIEHRSIRNMMALGAVVTAAGFAVVSQIDSLWQFYLVFATLVAVGLALMGQLPASTLVANWFVRRRGMALGVATMGISLSGVVMAPASTLLIERVGWRGTFMVFSAATLLVVLPVVWFFVVNRPEDLGLLPDGRSRAPSPERLSRAPMVPLASGEPMLELPTTESSRAATPEIVRSRNFWVIAVVVALNFCANGGLLMHLIPHATDLGFSAAQAAFVLSLVAGLGVVGKLLFGWVADHLDLRWALWMATSCQALAMVLLLSLTEHPSYEWLLAIGGLFGLGMGGLVPLWGSLVGAAFGRRTFGRAMGLMSPVMLPIQIVGIPFAGWTFDRFGTYTPAFSAFVALYVLAMALLFLLRLPHER